METSAQQPNTSSGTSLQDQIHKRIESLSYLPTSAAVAMKFVELGKDPDADPNDYAKVVSSDASLSSKLLALANSSWFGVRNKVTKPAMAVSLLGLGTVRTLAISYCLTGLHNDLRLTAEESKMFWSASLCKAVAARVYAAQVEPKAAEEAFTAALFQDFALPIMYAVAREKVAPLLQDVQTPVSGRLAVERELFGMDHAQVGRMVAQRLELPEVFVDAVAFHHDYPSLEKLMEKPIIAEAAYVASLFPNVIGMFNPHDGETLRRFLEEHAVPRGMDVAAYLETVGKEFNQLYAYFENGQAPQLKLAEMLELATREAADNTTRLMGTVHELLREAASAGREIHEVLSKQSKLEEAAVRDPLTGALNREGFTQRAGEVIARARRYGACIGLIYLDVDHFKQLNDTHGHHVGDAALTKLVSAAKEAMRPEDAIGRLGGDEFAVLVGECTRDVFEQIARKVVDNVAAQQIGRSSENIRISTSAGGVWVKVSDKVTPDLLSQAADKLMYTSKRAGGNRVTLAPTATVQAA